VSSLQSIEQLTSSTDGNSRPHSNAHVSNGFPETLDDKANALAAVASRLAGWGREGRLASSHVLAATMDPAEIIGANTLQVRASTKKRQEMFVASDILSDIELGKSATNGQRTKADERRPH
jgi:hypothetical protein